MTIEAQDKLVRRLVNKIRKNVDDIIIVEESNLNDADVVVVSFGVTSRVVPPAVEKARQEGIKVGQLRLKTVWPFPEKRVAQLAEKVKAWVVPEINLGQIYYEVERCAQCNANTVLISHAGGNIHDPKDILDIIRREVK